MLGDGTQVRADEDHHPDLFWAVRGGGGSFGIVTAMELRLFDIETAYAGMMLWDQEHAEKVLRAWAAWTVDAPDCVTTSFRMLNLPPMPELPPFLRGRQLVVVDGAVLAEDERAAEILADLRALEPETDTFARVPAAGLVRLHMDPEGPTPAVSVCAILGDLPDAAIETFLALTGRGSGSTLLAAELRQLGGALARPAEGAGALPMVDGAFVMFGVAIAATPEMAAQGQADGAALVDAMTAYASGRALPELRRVAGRRTPVVLGGGLDPAQGHPLRGRPGRRGAGEPPRAAALRERAADAVAPTGSRAEISSDLRVTRLTGPR